jgi:hypothetical protein
VLEQDFLSSKVGTESGYYFNGTNAKIEPGLSLQGFTDFTFVSDLTPYSGGSSSKSIYADYLSSASYSLAYAVAGNTIRVTITDGTLANYKAWATSDIIEYGKRYNLILARKDGELTLYVNGKKQTLRVVSTVGSGPSDSFLLATTPNIGSNNITSDLINADFYGFKVYNRALSDSEASKISRGQHLGFEDYGADGTASYSSNFSAGVDGWNATRGTLAANIDIGGEVDALRFTLDTSNNTHIASLLAVTTIGKRYRISGKFYVASTNSHVDGLRISLDGGSQVIKDYTSPATDTWVDFSHEVVAEQDDLYILPLDNGSTTVNDTGGDDVFYIKDVKITPLGLVLDLNHWGMSPSKWADNSGNSYHGTVTGATLTNELEYLYARYLVDETGGLGVTGEVPMKTATGWTWQSPAAGGGTGDILGASNGVPSYMVRWVNTDTITASTSLYDAADRIGIGYGASVPTGCKLAVNGDIKIATGSSIVNATTTTTKITLGAGYLGLANSDGSVRWTGIDLVPQQTSSDLGSTANKWDNLFYSGAAKWRGSLASEAKVLRVIDTDASGRTGTGIDAGELFHISIDNVTVSPGIGPSIQLQPYHDSNNDNTLTEGAAWEYFPLDNAWGSTGAVKIGSRIIATNQKVARVVTVGFNVPAHGGTATVTTETVVHNLGTKDVQVFVNESDVGVDTFQVVDVAWEPTTGNPTNSIDISIVDTPSIQYFKATIIG